MDNKIIVAEKDSVQDILVYHNFKWCSRGVRDPIYNVGSIRIDELRRNVLYTEEQNPNVGSIMKFTIGVLGNVLQTLLRF